MVPAPQLCIEHCRQVKEDCRTEKTWRTDHTEEQHSSSAQRDARGQGAETQEAQLPAHLKASYDSVSSEPITHLANSKLGEPWEPGCLALTTMSNDLCEVTLR